MRLVYLLRHAKSSWGTDAPDHDRPLAKRGRRGATAIGRYLRDEGIEPELVLCSTARRARETLERIEPALGTPAVRVERALYGASHEALLERLHSVPESTRSVMVIGHNPGLQWLAIELAEPSAERREIQAKYPTAALVGLAFPGASWERIEPGTGRVVVFVRPRDLE
jgi:phosphohistidine phosphatase